jgi:DNA polymerase-3 subunit delta'
MKPLAQLIGQPTAVELLNRAIATSRIAPAYLFVGTEGIGKSLAAKCFTEMLLIKPEENYAQARKKLSAGNHPDFFWVEPTYLHQGKLLTATEAEAVSLKRKTPPQIRIEQIREIVQFLARPPLNSPRLVVVIENAENMAESAANALLKTLEDPGKATIILMAPTVDSLLPTLISRCQKIPFYPLSEANIKLVLQRSGFEEILQYSELLKLAQGSPGRAILGFKQLQQLPSDLISKLKKLPEDKLEAIFLAKEISHQLELENQLWLINYLQYLYWDIYSQKSIIIALEKARFALKSHVQPRLVWECLWCDIFDS